jgi:hypothetical protein
MYLSICFKGMYQIPCSMVVQYNHFYYSFMYLKSFFIKILIILLVNITKSRIQYLATLHRKYRS